MKMYDVVVIGAGPGGSVLARTLAEAGKKTVLLEKDIFSGKSSACGGLFDRPYFDKYVGAPEIMENTISRNTFIMPWGDVSFDCSQVTVKRRIFDRFLSEKARAAGAELRTRTKALGWKVLAPGRAEVEVMDLNTRQRETVSCKVIAFADGPHTLAKNNPRFEHKKNKKYWAYAYAYEIDTVPFDPHEIKIYLDRSLFPWGYGWIFPNKTESNIGVGTIQKEIDKGIKVKDKLFEFINGYKDTAPLLKGHTIVDKKGGFIPMWPIDHFSDDSQVVIGDAGGMVSPLFGAGIDYTLDAGTAAAETILKAFDKNDFSLAMLKGYDENLEKSFLRDLRKQILVAKIIMASLRLGAGFPVKVLAVVAFGAKYTRWNKIRILFYPLLGKPAVIKSTEMLSHK